MAFPDWFYYMNLVRIVKIKTNLVFVYLNDNCSYMDENGSFVHGVETNEKVGEIFVLFRGNMHCITGKLWYNIELERFLENRSKTYQGGKQ